MMIASHRSIPHPHTTADSLSALRSSLQAALRAAPFGDSPDSRAPPHSCSQMDRCIATAPASAPVHVLRAMAVQALQRLEDDTHMLLRESLRQLRQQQQHREEGVDSMPDHARWFELPREVRESLIGRYGAHAQEARLIEAEQSADGLRAQTPGWPLLCRVAHQCSLWHQVLENKPRTASHDSATALAASFDDLEVAMHVELHQGPCGIRSLVQPAPWSLVDVSTHWQLRVHLKCIGDQALRISGLVLAENIRCQWPDALTEDKLPTADLCVLERIASIDHRFESPVVLQGRDCSVHVAIKIPRLRPNGTLETIPPLLFLQQILH